ncbi:MAG: hypothetical protein IJO06_09595 [Thermoguttaceae bacterium]|nr:hypothetical protein [Thermoguttaceae bacterium]
MSTAPSLPPLSGSPDAPASRLQTFFAQTLEPLGFTPRSNYRLFYYWTRRTETLEQRCGLRFDSEVGVNVWFDYRFTTPLLSWAAPDDAVARRILERFEQKNREILCRRSDFVARCAKSFIPPSEIDPALSPDAPDDAASPPARWTAANFLRRQIVPFFERRREALDLLRDFDAGALDAEAFYSRVYRHGDGRPFFGDDDYVACALRLGDLRLQAGQNAGARAEFNAALERLRALAAPRVDFHLPSFRRSELDFSETPAGPSYWNAVFEAALLGVEIAKRRIAVDGPGPKPSRSSQPPKLSSFRNPRPFKRPSFASPGVDEALVSPLLWTARFSDDETKAAEAIRRLEELANQATIVVYESPDECRFAENDAASPVPPPVDDAKSLDVAPPAQPRAKSRRRQVAPPTATVPETYAGALAALKKDLTRRVQEMFAQRLAPLGFKKKSSLYWTQTTRTLSRYCRFAFYKTYGCAVAFGYSVLPQSDCWANAPQDAESQALIARFLKEPPEFTVVYSSPDDCVSIYEDASDFYGRSLAWHYPPGDGDVVRLAEQIDAFLSSEIVPFYERFPEIDDLCREYDAGRLPQKFALGRFAGPRREFYAAQTSFRAGRYTESLDRFEAVQALSHYYPQPLDASTSSLFEVAKLGALSVRQTIAEKGPGQQATPRRPLPEPLATALPFAADYRARNVLRERDLADSPFEPEAALSRRRLDDQAELLRRLQAKATQLLEPQGFTQVSPLVWSRDVATFRQTFKIASLNASRDWLFEVAYRLRLDYSPWDAASQDVETQATLERLKSFAAKRWPDGALSAFATGYRRSDGSFNGLPREINVVKSLDDLFFSPAPPVDGVQSPTFAELLSKAEQGFTELVFPFFALWPDSRAVLTAPRLPGVFNPSYCGSETDVGEDRLGYALALFQAGRYAESSKKFDALSKMKKKPDCAYAKSPEYDDADWATLQEAARIAAASVRQLAKNKKLKR